MKKNLLAMFFEFLSESIMGAERSILDFLSAIVPYAVPVIPAYMTFYHTKNQMGFPDWVAATAAFTVEVLGITAISTAIRFYQHNRNIEIDKEKYKLESSKIKAEKNKAPFVIALSTYLFYIIVVLVVNVVLEKVSGTRSDAVILAIGLFSLLSVPSGVLISIRTQFSEMLEARYQRRIEAKGQSINSPQAIAPGMGFSNMAHPKHASDYHDKIWAMLDSEYSKGHVLAPKDVTERLNKQGAKLEHDKSKGYISGQITEWKGSKNLPK